MLYSKKETMIFSVLKSHDIYCSLKSYSQCSNRKLNAAVESKCRVKEKIFTVMPQSMNEFLGIPMHELFRTILATP